MLSEVEGIQVWIISLSKVLTSKCLNICQEFQHSEQQEKQGDEEQEHILQLPGEGERRRQGRPQKIHYQDVHQQHQWRENTEDSEQGYPALICSWYVFIVYYIIIYVTNYTLSGTLLAMLFI